MKKLVVGLVLSQDSGFDNFACLALQLERENINTSFLWPFYPGLLQGSFEKANKNLRNYNPRWRLKKFRSEEDWTRYTKKLESCRTLMFAQTPYLADHYSPSSIDFLTRFGPGYINYGLNLIENDPFGFDCDIFLKFSPLLVANFREKELYRKGSSESREIIVTGMPGPFEVSLRNEKTFYKASMRKQITLMWAPHWIQDWSTWEKTLPEIDRFARENPRIRILVRPHQLLTAFSGSKLPEGYSQLSLELQESTAALSDFLKLDNVELSSGSLVEDCVQSDLLITDGVSIIVYWAATGKPIGITRKSDSPKFSKDSSWIQENSSFIETETRGSVYSWITNQVTFLLQPNLPKSVNSQLIEGSLKFYSRKSAPGKVLATWLKKH